MTTRLFNDGALKRSLKEAMDAADQDDPAKRRAREGAAYAALYTHLLQRQSEGSLPYSGLHDFFHFASANLGRSHSQIFQDLWVLHQTGQKRDGYFVEFGACDGLLLSNTYLLERDYGWSGILAEPNPTWQGALKKNRSAAISGNCVHSVSGETLTLRCTTEMPELSRLEAIIPDDVHERAGNRSVFEQVETESISLDDLLDRHDAPDVIDYISVDTEGSELEILEQFSFDRHKVHVWTIEHGGDHPRRKAIYDLMTANGYVRWWTNMSRWDDWYMLAERS